MPEIFPVWCDQCKKQGYVRIERSEDALASHRVVCSNCGWQTSLVFCPRCQIGGQFVEGVETRPQCWTCPECGTRYELPQTFYSEYVLLRFGKTDEFNSQFLYDERIDLRFLHGEKRKILLTNGLLIFLLVLPCFLVYTRDAWPLLIVLVVAWGWSLMVWVGHRPMPWEKFNALTDLEKRQRAYYDSAWAHLHGGGFALFMAIIFAWAALLIARLTPLKSLVELIAGISLLGGLSLLLAYIGVKSFTIAATQFRKWGGGKKGQQ